MRMLEKIAKALNRNAILLGQVKNKAKTSLAVQEWKSMGSVNPLDDATLSILISGRALPHFRSATCWALHSQPVHGHIRRDVALGYFD